MNPEISERQFIAEIKEKVRSAQYEALKTVNVKLIQLYWEIANRSPKNKAKAGVNQSSHRCQKSCKQSFQNRVVSRPQIFGI